MFADDGEAPAAPCRTASLLGDVAEDRCEAFDGGRGSGGDGRDGGGDGEKKKLGRPKGSPNKRVGSPSSEPSVSTSATGSRAKKAKTSKGMCICRGCNKKFDSDAVSTSTDFDNDCKRSLDRLRHIAENEGPDAYAAFKTAFADTPKLQKMLKAYWAKVGGVPKKGVRSKSGAPKFSVTQYTESMKASSGIEWRGRGRMMWEKHWLEYAQTVEGGKHTEEQAQTKWNEWKRQKDADPRSIIWDLAGPRKENPLQFRIDLAASVDFLGTYSHEKTVSSMGKAQKNATKEDIMKMRDAALSNSESITAGNMEVNFSAMARKMVGAGAGPVEGGGGSTTAFAGDTMKIDGFRNFLRDRVDSSSDEGEGDEDQPASAKKAKTKKNVEGDRTGKLELKGHGSGYWLLVTSRPLGPRKRITIGLIGRTAANRLLHTAFCRVPVLEVHIRAT